jgi:hypothetical protein
LNEVLKKKHLAIFFEKIFSLQMLDTSDLDTTNDNIRPKPKGRPSRTPLHPHLGLLVTVGLELKGSHHGIIEWTSFLV